MTRIERVAAVPDGFADRLAALWREVTLAGGAVGFSPADDLALIDAATNAVLAAVDSGAEALFAATGDDGALLGVVFLVRGAGPRVAHRAEIRRLMVHPGAQRRGLGGALLRAAVTYARALGLRTVYLGTRSGQGLEKFYLREGWTERGRWPGAVHVGDGDFRDEVWFTVDLQRPAP